MSSDSATDLNRDDERMLATELSRLVAISAAPDEELLFDDAVQEYFQNPDAVLRPAEGRGVAGGFGGVVEVLLTPVILAAATKVVHYLAGIVVEVAEERARPRLVALVRRLFNPASAAPGVDCISLSDDQIKWVRTTVFETAMSVLDDKIHAQLIADAMVGRIVFASRN